MTADEATPRGENEKPDVPANDEQTQKRRTITNFEVKKLLEAAIVLMREIKIQSNLGNLADTHSDPHIWGYRLGRCHEASTVFCQMYSRVFGNKKDANEVAAQGQIDPTKNLNPNADLKIPDGKDDYPPPPPPPSVEPASEPSDSSGAPDANTVQQTSSASDTPPPPPSSQPNLTVTQSRIGGKKRKEAQAQMFFDSSTGHVTDHP